MYAELGVEEVSEAAEVASSTYYKSILQDENFGDKATRIAIANNAIADAKATSNLVLQIIAKLEAAEEMEKKRRGGS